MNYSRKNCEQFTLQKTSVYYQYTEVLFLDV